MTFLTYLWTWYETFRLARKYGIEGAKEVCKKEMMRQKMRYYRLTGRKWGA